MRVRSLANALAAMGFPVGGAIGELMAAYLLKGQGWQAVFFAGFLATLIMIPVVAIGLPESPVFLLTQTGVKSLRRLNAVLVRCGQAAVTGMPAPRSITHRGYRAIFARGMRRDTLLLSGVNLLYAAAASYVFTWLPQMVVDAGFTPSDGGTVGAVAQLCGLIGGVLLGAFARRLGLQRLTLATLICLGLTIPTLSLPMHALAALTMVSALAGFLLFTAAAGLNAFTAENFVPEARASGVGFVLGVGRIGGALSPVLAGSMLQGGIDKTWVSVAF